ncbi:MAG: NADH-quinone oxidoreductase subunit N [bacterium]
MVDISFSLLLPEIVLIGGGFIIIAIDLIFKRRVGQLILPISILIVATSIYIAINLGGMTADTIMGTFVIDTFAVVMKIVIMLATIFIIMLIDGYKPLENVAISEFIGLILIATSAMCFMVSSGDMVLLYVSIEFTSIISYILVGYLRKSAISIEAGVKYFLFGAVSAGVMLLGMALLYVMTGTTNIIEIVNVITKSSVEPSVILISICLLVVGLAFKMAVVPMHLWAPDVYQGAPTPITAYLSVASKTAGVGAFLRVSFLLSPVLISSSREWVAILSFASITSMILGTVVGMLQNNIKRLLAYSSIAHIGFIIIGVIVGPPLGLIAIVYYVVAYLFMNIGAFTIVVMVADATGGYEIDDYIMLSRRKPVLALLLTVFLVSLIGIPPTVGFFAKFYIFASVINSGYILLAIIGVLSSVIGLFMYARILKVMYLDKKDGVLEKPLNRIPLLSWAVVGMCLIGTFIFGIYPKSIVEIARTCLHMFNG